MGLAEWAISVPGRPLGCSSPCFTHSIPVPSPVFAYLRFFLDLIYISPHCPILCVLSNILLCPQNRKPLEAVATVTKAVRVLSVVSRICGLTLPTESFVVEGSGRSGPPIQPDAFLEEFKTSSHESAGGDQLYDIPPVPATLAQTETILRESGLPAAPGPARPATSSCMYTCQIPGKRS